MAEHGSINREELRRHLRQRTREAELYYDDPAFLKRERENRWNRFRDGLTCLAFVLCFCLAFMFYAHNYRYTTYSVDREISMGGLSRAQLQNFSGGTVVIGRDALSFVKKGKVQWTESLSFEDPVFVSEGGYFAVCDRDSYSLYVCDINGVVTCVRVSRRICGMDISAAGVTAVYTETNEAAYISYFDKYGSRLSVELKTVFTASGYPVHISLSPNGQKLMVLFYSMQNGIGESRLVIYDFENGKSSDSYIVSKMDDLYDSGTFLVNGEFFDDTHFAAVGDDLIRFGSCQGNDVSYTDVPLSENVRSVLVCGKHILVTEKTEQGSVCTVYNEKGSAISRFDAPEDYDMIRFTDRNIVFGLGRHLTYYNINGRVRWDGDLVTAPVSCEFDGRSLMINNGEVLRKLTFK